ncbi:uncharacterized protein LOC134752620 [Cydia strobilella]|uniref:uncharacterized protein LOC134752620 n=1 Tax=Cydia strobilella TaxID=1100964 RepID=UPI0030063F70
MMIFVTYLNYLYSSILFYLLSKIVCSVVTYRRSMHYKRSPTLSSIPEKNETEEKWVPKKKHEVLKAKYKCLKKLFQIYDASVIGMLPMQEAYAAGDTSVVEESDDIGRKLRKRKRSHRVKLDACAGTSDHEIQTAVQVDCSKTNTSETESCTKAPSTKAYAATQASRESLLASEHECGCAKTSNVVFQPTPCPCPRPRMSRQRKRTRFQCFVQRLLGLRSPNRHGCLDTAVSECDIHRLERRRHRKIRFRRARRPARAQSEGAMHTPAHVCAQTVQRNCLLDTTPRQCPIAGCRMMLYGIINYNDHLNLCHFPGRRYVCHFCHEGFERDADKLQHESEHIGLNHHPPLPPSSPPPTSRSGITSVTQTDPEPTKEHDEKLKKIVSFFDKIVDSTQILTDVKKSRHSEMHLPTSKCPTDNQTEVSASDGHSKHTSSCSDVTGKRLTYSCNDVRRRNNYRRSLGSDAMSQCCSENCNFCGENFDYSQALERKFGEFHSCGALPARRRADAHVTSSAASSIVLDQASSIASCVVNCNGVLSLTDNYEDAKPTQKPSTSVVFTASECSRKVSTRSLADRFKSYKWEPCTRIIRV